MPYPFGVQATVTNGEQTEIVITKDDRICLYHEPTGCGIYVGPATRKRVDQLIFNLQQLRSVMPEDGGTTAQGGA